MAKRIKKKRTKKYNRTKVLDLEVRANVNKCRLFRWESANTDKFTAFGPFEKEENTVLMTQAALTPQVWLPVVTSWFLDKTGNYLEEVLTFPPVGPIVLADEITDINLILNEAINEAKQAGTSEDYKDTCVALYPYTESLEAKLQNDDWVRLQAVNRAATILESRL